MPERSGDWLKQAKRDVESARKQMEACFYEWACFIAQQSSEKAVKAIYQKMGAETWGHSVTDLLRGLKERMDIPDSLVEKAKQLDKFYILARYPNGWVSGIPADYINKEDASNAISNSEEILQFCTSFLVK